MWPVSYTHLGSALGEDGTSYVLTIKLTRPGCASQWILENWKEGDRVDISGPLGDFYYDRIRDAGTVVALAGGSGITPFYSMAEAIADGIEDFRLTILYGSRTAEGILLKDELDEVIARAGGKVKVVHVLSDEAREGYEHGFLTAELVKKYAPEGDYSVFMCGPQAMYDYEEHELKKLGLPRRRIRRELSGDWLMSEPSARSYKLTLDVQGYRRTVDCLENESLEWAIERAGIKDVYKRQGFESSLEVVAELGILLCRGTLLSMAMVLLALPALLMLFDPLTAKLTLKAGFLKKSDKEVETK